MKTFHVMPYRQLFALLTIGFGSVCIAHAETASSSANQQIGSTSSGVQTEVTTDENLLDQIPRWVDATPTIFPEQSNEPIVPPTEQTEDQTWVDRKQKKIRNWADRTSEKIDNWFGEVDPQKPASATIRVMVDNYWNEYDNFEIKPRIRGKIKLPTLEKRLSVVFGDDSLDDEFNNSPANINQNPNQDPNKKLDGKRTRDDNSSIALRWSNFSKKLPFETDADLGIRSGDDIYVRLKASRDWQLRNDFKFYAEQIYRYGIDSENYLRTNLELTHARPNQPILSNQFSLTYADDQDDDLAWENRTFREHSFFANNRFNYGIYTSGYYNDNDLR